MELSKLVLGLQTMAVIVASQAADRNLENAIGPGTKHKLDEQLSVIEQDLRRLGYGVGTKEELDAFISKAEEALRRVDFVAGTASGSPWMEHDDIERYRDLRKRLRRHLREARRKRGKLR